ncbi:MAG: acyl-CoA dehydrogenase family protein [Aquabacterium sp.]|jgi:alkylation response protein AidB-like acyl-CoA dehydrogenase|uniref:acyl-CoA dehydrogenase family protein n=1 Tax=Aquabacterium sp. TaxID=1872578 RepID=UPI002A362FFB|nr:acyl-CoA dehydrogenase family protein [Aquabacterium sp.]MDX9844410.1 acyl-CoA dehydrogenase family protein [Aquabacterium sp.]
MNFNQSDDRRMLADSLDRYLAEQYPIETRHAITQSATGYSAEQWAQFAELGVIGALFTEEQGGFGGTGFDIATVFESIGKGLAVEPLLATAVLAGSALAHAGNDAQKALIEEIIAGGLIATLAYDEADAHYAVNRVSTRATRDGDHYVIDGAKAVVPFADQAQQIIVSARTSGNVDDEAGISLFVVPAGTAGLSVRAYGNVDGTRAGEVTLSQVRVPTSALLGAEGQGHATLEYAVGRGVLALAAESLGAMEVCKKATIEYLQTRKQFGKAIGSFQALQHRMATVLLEIEQARSAVINAASAVDGNDRIARERALSAAKYTVGKTGTLVAEESIQLHGGIGVTWELPMPHYAKRLILIDHVLGDEDHHLQRFIALGQQ